MTTTQQVEECLDKIRPALAMHSGNVQLLEVDEKEGIVKVKLEGACKGCPMSQITLKMGIEAEIISNVPTIKQVIAVDEESAKVDGCCATGEKNEMSDEDKWFYELLGQPDEGGE